MYPYSQFKIVYMVEDQKIKTNPTASPWRLFISILRNKKRNHHHPLWSRNNIIKNR